ncbi:MAG TPA: nicotinate-nucleotide adenylyltransferase [Ktedonobacterales bacterium]|jgi:nicotinate-nucleotide adenylyltransferase|nr:nicotinate-nucleotide adenylyltransferase [Ktedonobacterales bacterium]
MGEGDQYSDDRLLGHPHRKDTSVQTGARYGILGGTFDPPHLGHLVLAQEVFAQLGLDRVWFVPTGSSPHKVGQRITAAAHRRAMVELAIAGDARFALSTVELERAGPSYTVDTLRQLRTRWGDVRISLVLGWDMLLYLPFWHDPGGVIAAADEIAAVHRPGFGGNPEALEQLEAHLPELRAKLTLVAAPQLELAARALRERVAANLPIRYLVPDAVCDYIETHKLYRQAGMTVGQEGAGREIRGPRTE